MPVRDVSLFVDVVGHGYPLSRQGVVPRAARHRRRQPMVAAEREQTTEVMRAVRDFIDVNAAAA
ncbi:hypothetical protein [Actinomadura madurae]|uniref:hypothetical protein n=1 Tax=Actinomadura madurae TaxID=1993 RepID=UPI0020D1FC47|nr:hypothetical protein [Actinomadura madurae]MCP9953203.1 hypothetical protein [Actinomadura madurae]MCP9969963.1 hypothetical protein [Actinomadura madurae]MCP9982420.1 hypothetical protein [Actinomadura madurae]MCQ0006053.1 hypothetical protein [Actinomadura madurae]MCQ0018664.1 hypothetical protein [Actinomadura madurae]